MKIRVGKVEFEVTPVSAAMRAAVTADPNMAQAMRREVWEWDAVARKGTPLVPVVQQRVTTLPNGLSFFVARAGSEGPLVKNDAASAKMAQRMLKATGAKDLRDLMGALNRVIDLPRLRLPLDVFRPLNETTSYRLVLASDYAVVQLRAADRNLVANLLMPAQVGVHAEITAIPDQAAHDAKGIDLAALRPGFIVPAHTPATQTIRRAALAQRLQDLQQTVAAQGGPETATPAQRALAGQLSAEWKVLTPKPAAAPASA
ncbi:MAG: hypothetical protein H3C51_08035 [Rubellimicrobium sp.]|nr:hypothetical protein [Rubellimicrobium sp.]